MFGLSLLEELVTESPSQGVDGYFGIERGPRKKGNKKE